jgi:hypothetical protein
VYWVPGHKLDEWAAVAQAVERAATGRPSAVYVIKHRLDVDAVRAVQDAVVGEVRADAERIAAEVGTGELGGRALDTRRKEAQALREKAIGLDAGEGHRLTWARPAPGADRKPSREAWLDEHVFTYWYPLHDWGMDRAACEESIRAAGLPVPPKSACFFCPASKRAEILWLRDRHPALLDRALAIERAALPSLTTVKGLGRSFAWAEYLAAADRLPLFPAPGG